MIVVTQLQINNVIPQFLIIMGLHVVNYVSSLVEIQFVKVFMVNNVNHLTHQLVIVNVSCFVATKI